MGSLAQHLWQCLDCKGHFRKTRGESLHASGNACTLCGSRFVQRVIQSRHDSGANVLGAVLNNHGHGRQRAVAEPVDLTNTPHGRKRSERDLRKHRLVETLMSRPNAYRRQAIENGYQRYLATKAKAARRARLNEFVPIETLPAPS